MSDWDAARGSVSAILLHPESVGVSYTGKQSAWAPQQEGLVELWVLVAVWSPPPHTRGVGSRAPGLGLVSVIPLASHVHGSLPSAVAWNR